MSRVPPNFVETANQRYIEARRFWGNWRADARDDFAFVAGQQWLHDDELILIAQKRPPITFNYSEKMIDAVVGAEVAARQEISYAPREISDSGVAELWTNAIKWVRDQSNIEDEETDAFRDTLICGMGWTHTKVSYETDPEGMLETDRVDPLEMSVDPAARKPGVVDRRYSFRDIWIDERIARKQWPSALFTNIDTDATGQGVQHIRQGHRYEDGSETDYDQRKDQVLIRHYECVELEPYYRVQAAEGFIDVDAADFTKMRAELDSKGVQYVRMQKRVYYFGWFNGETLLEADLSPTQQGFTYQCITGKRDRNKNTWYGLTRVMKDPQRWANKWLSQILHIVNSNAKGGLLAEINAFVDSKKAADEWAMPESITLLKEGGITKVKEKTMTSFPSGLDRLMEFALASLPQVTGINLEALGLAARDQANVLEQSRKQAAYGLLAPVFDSLRRYRKCQGRILLDLMRKYISDGRLIRIGGPQSQQFVQLTKQPESHKFDVIVDQSPTSPDVKRETWQQLQNLIPAALKSGMPIPPTLFKYAPIPVALAMEWEQYISQNSQQLKPEDAQKLQQQMQQIQEENQKLKQALQDKTQELQMKQQAMEAELSLKQQAMVKEHELKMAQLQQEMQLKQQEHEQQLAISAITTQQQLQQSEQQAAQQLQQSEQQNEQQLALAQQNADAKNALEKQKLRQKPTPKSGDKS